MKTHTRHVFWFTFALFACLVVYLVKFVVIDSPPLMESPANPRIDMVAKEVKRGQILDAKGTVLASSTLADGIFTRNYPYGGAFAHLVGFDTLGRSGVEATSNFALQKLGGEIPQRVNHMLTGEPLEGNSIVLTVDADLQQMAVESLGKQKGAIVVMEPSTGRILAMAAYPNFNPNDMASQWDTLKENKEESPLLNRATQGLYPPGSVFKIVTAAAAYEFFPSLDQFTYDCTGSATFGDKTIHCFDNKAHGNVDITKAFALSCNTFFATIGTQLGSEHMHTVTQRLLFNQPYPSPFVTVPSSFTLPDEPSNSETVETAIGQGKTLVTPLHMAMVTAAVANGGIMMEPYVVDHARSKGGAIQDKHLPTPIATVFTLEQSAFLVGLMTEVVAHGTGTPSAIDGIEVAAKTGTAEIAGGDDHGWFVAFAPASKPQVVVSIVLENSGGPRKAQKMAKKIMTHVLEAQ